MILLIVFVCDLSKKYNTSTNAFRLCRCILKRMSSAWLASFCCWSSFRFLSSPPPSAVPLLFRLVARRPTPSSIGPLFLGCADLSTSHTPTVRSAAASGARRTERDWGYAKWVKPRFGSEAIVRENQPLHFLQSCRRSPFPRRKCTHSTEWVKWNGLNWT